MLLKAIAFSISVTLLLQPAPINMYLIVRIDNFARVTTSRALSKTPLRNSLDFKVTMIS